ncbi:hypothetical protein GCM10029964_059680 [Kibdelosporangium lantanae]
MVFDNCEHVIQGIADLARKLVSMTKDLRILTTSRAPLGLSSESVYHLPELPLPVTVELFTQRARAARPGVDLPSDVVTDLCRHLDGLPLAVELAAARVRTMAVADVARRLDDRFALLRGGSRDAPARHRTLHAVVDWSWNLLDPAERAAMRSLAVFPGGFTVQAAEHVVPDALDTVEHLVDQSLLRVTETPVGTRMTMLETVRAFCAAVEGDHEQAVTGFLAWARAYGTERHEDVFGPGAFTDAVIIKAEQDNLLYALRVALDRGDLPTVAAVTAVLAGVWLLAGDYARIVSLVEDTSWALSHHYPDPDDVEVARAAACLSAGAMYLLQGPARRSGRWWPCGACRRRRRTRWPARGRSCSSPAARKPCWRCVPATCRWSPWPRARWRRTCGRNASTRNGRSPPPNRCWRRSTMAARPG